MRALAKASAALVSIGALGLCACTAVLSARPVRHAAIKWQSQHGRSHQLSAQIWSQARGVFISEGELIGELARTDAVLIGERHDNPDHHMLQTRLIRELAPDKLAGVGFEHLTPPLAGMAQQVLREGAPDFSALGRTLRWEERGWPAWDSYRPIFESIQSLHLKIFSANLAQAEIREAAKSLRAPSDWPAALVDKWQADLPAQMQQSLLEQLQIAHCNILPAAALAPIARLQRTWDAQMAYAVSRQLAGGKVVLLAGNGHVRSDWGVPYYLHAAAPHKKVVSIALLEVSDGENNPSSYAKALSAALLPYDYVWFSPVWDPSNPCMKYKGALERLGSGSQAGQ